MARYHGPKARVNRRLGLMLYENAGAARALERRNSPPGCTCVLADQATTVRL